MKLQSCCLSSYINNRLAERYTVDLEHSDGMDVEALITAVHSVPQSQRYELISNKWSEIVTTLDVTTSRSFGDIGVLHLVPIHS